MSILAPIRQVCVPLMSLMILILGSGFFVTLLTLDMHAMKASHFVIGLLSAAYYLGIVVGSIYVGNMIRNSGAIRVYAACASFTAAIMLVHGLCQDPYLWVVLRFLSGLSMAGMFIVIESWVLMLATDDNRGQVLALYMVAIYLTNALGQGILNFSFSNPIGLFCVASILASISVVPICISKIKNPQLETHDKMGFKKLVKTSPSALLGCFIAGMILGSVYGLLPDYGAEKGMNTADISWLMGMTILGGTLLQYPIGRASDFISRRWVMLFVCFTLIGTSAVLQFTPVKDFYILMVTVFFFGGCAFTLYPLSISHMCDLIPPNKVVEASQGLLVFYGIGAVIGPIVSPVFVSFFGIEGLMIYFITTSAFYILFITWRRTQKPAPALKDQQEFVSVPTGAGSVLSELDPRRQKN